MAQDRYGIGDTSNVKRGRSACLQGVVACGGTNVFRTPWSLAHKHGPQAKRSAVFRYLPS